MKVMATGKYNQVVWMKSGEDFPGCYRIPGKQGFYSLWTGMNDADFRKCTYLGPRRPSPEFLREITRD